MGLKKGIRQLVEEANAAVTTVGVEEARQRADAGDTLIVDLRDIRELWREGTIPGATHAPRGMLEFWVDPESPYHKPIFAEGQPLLLFCASGWRSALAAKTLLEMGLDDVSHLEGGFTAWRKAGAPVQPVEPKLPGQQSGKGAS